MISDPARFARKGDLQGLLRLLSHRSRSKRSGAAYFLRDFPGHLVESALLRALDDDSFVVRRTALDSLIELDNHRPPEPVLRALRGHTGSETEPLPDAKEMLELGVWRLRSLRPVETLARALREENLLEGEDRNSRLDLVMAIRALGELGDRQAIDVLVSVLRHPRQVVRREAVKALGEIEASEAVEPLAKLLRKEKGEVWRSSARALSSIDDPRAGEALRDAARKGPFLKRWVAARALKRAKGNNRHEA